MYKIIKEKYIVSLIISNQGEEIIVELEGKKTIRYLFDWVGYEMCIETELMLTVSSLDLVFSNNIDLAIN